MRISGWLFLVGGFLLCASIAWATIGFLFMGLGLVCLRIAERERERSGTPVASRAEKPETRWEPPSVVQSTPDVVRREANERETGEADLDNNTEPRSYDEQRWRLLLSADEDIRRLTTILAQYGQSYVDEFAAAYLALNDKQQLPMIVEQLVASAMRNRDRGRDNSADKSRDESVVGRNARETPRSDRLRAKLGEADGGTSNSVDENNLVKGDGRKARSLHQTPGKTDGPPEAIVADRALNAKADSAPNGTGSEEGVDGSWPIAGQATELLPPPAEPPAALGPDPTTGTLQDDPMDDDNLTNLLRRLSKP